MATSGTFDYAKGAELMSVQQEIDASPEADLTRILAGLEDSVNVFTGNAEELLTVCARLDDPSQVELLMEGDVRADITLGVRRLHNYVASVRALRDHSCAVRNELYGGGRDAQFYDEWNAKARDIFAGNPTNEFIGDLRNYIQHRALPIGGVRLQHARNAGTASCFYLDTKKLLLWKDWDGRSKEYMAGHDPLRVSALVTEYRELVTEFHAWRRRRQEEVHAEDLQRHRARLNRERVLMKELGVDERFAHPV